MFGVNSVSEYTMLVASQGGGEADVHQHQIEHMNRFKLLCTLSGAWFIMLLLITPELPAQPNAQVIGHDWGQQWVTTLYNPCTKNRVNEYEALVEIRNLGNQDLKITSFALVGPDADDGYFGIDALTPSTTIKPGTILKPATPGDTPKVFQKVLFRPKEELRYECAVLLTTEGGSSTGAILAGTGIESHGTFISVKFDTLQFTESLGRDTVRLASSGHRPLTITNLRIGGTDASSFKFEPEFVLPTIANPWILKPDSVIPIPMRFEPSSVGLKTAQIEFTGDQSTCSDSMATLRAYKHITLGVERTEDLAGLALMPNAPNPFRESTTIGFRLMRPGRTTLAVYNTDGERITTLVDENLEAGTHSAPWNAAGLPNGIYLYRLTTEEGVRTRTMILQR